MDVKHKHTYAIVKIPGQADEIMFDGPGMVSVTQQIMLHLMTSERRFNGSIHIELSPRPLTESSRNDPFSPANNYGFDESELTPFDELPQELKDRIAASDAARENDPLYAEWQTMAFPAARLNATPQQLGMLRKHMDTNYQNQPLLWDGIHHW